MDSEEDLVQELLSELNRYLQKRLSVDAGLIDQLQAQNLLAYDNAQVLRTEAKKVGNSDAQYGLLDYMKNYYDDKMLQKFVTELENYGKPAKLRLVEVAETIKAKMKEKGLWSGNEGSEEDYEVAERPVVLEELFNDCTAVTVDEPEAQNDQDVQWLKVSTSFTPDERLLGKRRDDSQSPEFPTLSPGTGNSDQQLLRNPIKDVPADYSSPDKEMTSEIEGKTLCLSKEYQGARTILTHEEDDMEPPQINLQRTMPDAGVLEDIWHSPMCSQAPVISRESVESYANPRPMSGPPNVLAPEQLSKLLTADRMQGAESSFHGEDMDYIMGSHQDEDESSHFTGSTISSQGSTSSDDDYSSDEMIIQSEEGTDMAVDSDDSLMSDDETGERLLKPVKNGIHGEDSMVAMKDTLLLESKDPIMSDTKPEHSAVNQTVSQVMNILQGPRIEGVGNPNSDQGPSTNDGDFVWILLGVTGAGKSCLGNFIFGEKVFEVSSHISISQTVSAFRESRTVEGQNLHIIDTPGLGDTGRIGTQESRVEDAANDAAHLIVELTKIMLTRNGISSFLIIVPLNHRDFAGLQQLLDFCDILGDYWNHSILVFTHGLKYGSTESQQYIELENVLGDARGPVVLRNAYNRVNKRAVIVEAKRWRKDRFGTGYRSRTVAKLVSLSGSITATHGCYQDNLQSIGNKAYERANLLLQRQFKDLKSKEAKAAIFQEVYEEVRQVIHDLIEVKLTGGSIDKPKEMHKIKQQKLVTLNDQVAMLQQQAEEAHREICRLEDINKDLQQNKRILSRSVKRLEAADKRKSQQIERGKEGRKQLMGQVKAERKKRQDAKRQLEDEKKEMKKVRKEFVLLEKQKTTAAEEIVRLREAKCNETTRFKKEKLDIMRLRKKDKMELQQATRKQLKRKEDKTKEVKDKKKALQKQMKVEQAAKEVVLQKLQTAEKALQSAKRDAEKESMQKQMKVDKVTREAELHILRWQEAEKALQSVQHEAEREKDEYKIQCQALQNKLKSTEEEVVREKRDFELQFNILQREKDAAEKKIKDMKERNWWKRLRNED